MAGVMRYTQPSPLHLGLVVGYGTQISPSTYPTNPGLTLDEKAHRGIVGNFPWQ